MFTDKAACVITTPERTCAATSPRQCRARCSALANDPWFAEYKRWRNLTCPSSRPNQRSERPVHRPACRDEGTREVNRCAAVCQPRALRRRARHQACASPAQWPQSTSGSLSGDDLPATPSTAPPSREPVAPSASRATQTPAAIPLPTASRRTVVPAPSSPRAEPGCPGSAPPRPLAGCSREPAGSRVPRRGDGHGSVCPQVCAWAPSAPSLRAKAPVAHRGTAHGHQAAASPRRQKRSRCSRLSPSLGAPLVSRRSGAGGERGAPEASPGDGRTRSRPHPCISGRNCPAPFARGELWTHVPRAWKFVCARHPCTHQRKHACEWAPRSSRRSSHLSLCPLVSQRLGGSVDIPLCWSERHCPSDTAHPSSHCRACRRWDS
mmetsp:Transcript_34101/g.90936  ORF Transcript_34101/g.90936 Transcript_34101/m.90936 type:complete len:379 (+) Transcript_34101:424-1560(+)